MIVLFLCFKAIIFGPEQGCEHGDQSDHGDKTQSKGHGRRQGSSSGGFCSYPQYDSSISA